jgi:hypothetical protein
MDRHRVVDKVRAFVRQLFNEPPSRPSLLDADKHGYALAARARRRRSKTTGRAVGQPPGFYGTIDLPALAASQHLTHFFSENAYRCP